MVGLGFRLGLFRYLFVGRRWDGGMRKHGLGQVRSGLREKRGRGRWEWERTGTVVAVVE